MFSYYGSKSKIINLYQNSAAYNSVMGCTTRTQLLNRKPYTLGAIEYHEREGNVEQVLFIKYALALIEKRLKKWEVDGD